MAASFVSGYCSPILRRAKDHDQRAAREPAVSPAFRWLGIDVRRARKHPALIDFLENRRVSVVYDVGANVGQFGLALRRRGYRGRIVSVEPVKDAFDRLKQIAAADGNWEATRCAIGLVKASSGSTSLAIPSSVRPSGWPRWRRRSIRTPNLWAPSAWTSTASTVSSKTSAIADKNRYPGLRARSPRGGPDCAIPRRWRPDGTAHHQFL